MHYTQVLSQQDIQKYIAQGFSEEDIQNAINESVSQVKKEGSNLQASYNKAQQAQKSDPRAGASNSFVSGAYNENLIQWQLELDSILERIEHMLRGDKPTWKSGSVIWAPASDEDKITLNDFGVAEVMRVLSNYVNRNTILSNYDNDTINGKMFDLGNELADLFFLKYEEIGLNTLNKRKLYPIIVRELVDVVHSSYLRALHGGERESLREARQVTQTESGGSGITVNTGIPPRQRGILNPARWLGGK